MAARAGMLVVFLARKSHCCYAAWQVWCVFRHSSPFSLSAGATTPRRIMPTMVWTTTHSRRTVLRRHPGASYAQIGGWRVLTADDQHVLPWCNQLLFAGLRHMPSEGCLQRCLLRLWHELLREWLHLQSYATKTHYRDLLPSILTCASLCSWTVRTLAGVTCTSNDEPFDSSEIVNAGDDAVTTVCPPGHVGNMTRRCVWNGPTSSHGVWATPINNCKRTSASQMHCNCIG